MAADPPRIAEIEALLAERGDHLLRAAIVLTGSREAGEDLLQAALERAFRHWRKISTNPEGYLRRTLYHLAADGWRRQGRLRGKLGLLTMAAVGSHPDETARVDHRDQLVRLLLQLPARQRTAVVLRYWEELSEAETAEVMGCSPGTVKAAASRGLRKLRKLRELSELSELSELNELSGTTDDAPTSAAHGR